MRSANKQPSNAAGRSVPKHSSVTASLLDEIRAGRYQPGDLLPSEPELSRHFGVSRHTVRVALRALYEKGLILSQQGRGSIVQATTLEPRYTFACNSVADLLQYAQATPRRVLGARRRRLDAALATWLGGAPGSYWWEVHTCRSRERGGAVIASSMIYLPARFAAAVRALAGSQLPLFALIESKHGPHVAQVRQRFAGATASATEAADLGLAPGAAVMCVERRFFDERGGVLEVSRSVHPPEDFHYEITVRQVVGQTPA